MKQLVESLWRLYNKKHSITKQQVMAMKGLTEEEKAYILGNGNKEHNEKEVVNSLPS